MTPKRSKNSSAKYSSRAPVLVDFDETLIDTSRIKERLFDFIERVQDPAAKEELMRAFKPFNKENYKMLGRSIHSESKKALAFYNSLFTPSRRHNYSGAEEFLKQLRKKRELWLLTYGYRPIQERKLKQSGLEKYFKRLIFTADRSKEVELRKIAKRHPGAVVLDDEPYVCTLAEYLGFRAISVKKGVKNAAYYRGILRSMDTAD